MGLADVWAQKSLGWSGPSPRRPAQRRPLRTRPSQIRPSTETRPDPPKPTQRPGAALGGFGWSWAGLCAFGLAWPGLGGLVWMWAGLRDMSRSGRFGGTLLLLVSGLPDRHSSRRRAAWSRKSMSEMKMSRYSSLLWHCGMEKIQESRVISARLLGKMFCSSWISCSDSRWLSSPRPAGRLECAIDDAGCYRPSHPR